MRTLAIGDIHGCHTALVTLLAKVAPQATDRVAFLGDYIDRGPASREVIDTLIELEKWCAAVFLRGNHEVMMLDALESPWKSNLWQSYGGTEALRSYGATHLNWTNIVPASHWGFLTRTRRFFETEKNIFVHACLDPSLEMDEQPDWLLYWEYFDKLGPHKSGKRIVCGHSVQKSGLIKDVGFATCIDTGPAGGGWLTCLDVDSLAYWQANERGQTREGRL